MKKFLLLACLGLMGLTMQAQDAAPAKKKSCAKTCASKKAAKAASIDATPILDDETMAMAIAAAEADESIEVRTCAKSGKHTFMRMQQCPVTEKVSYTEVSYDADQRLFVNVAPPAATMEAIPAAATDDAELPAKATKKACSKKCAKTCASKKAVKTELKTEELPSQERS